MALRSYISFFLDQYRTSPPVAKADLEGKTVIVVGANTGLGFEATQHFARMGPQKLILACRSKAKGEDAIERLKKATGYDSAELWLVDLADFASVRQFADRALDELERLDILLLNAAIMTTPKYSLTKDGWEETIQVNDLSLSLLALRLLPSMLDTAERFNTLPRIVITSSVGHYWASFEDKVLESSNTFAALSDEEYCTPKILGARYFDSKLLNVFFTRALNNHLKNQPVIVTTTNPGYCYSELERGDAGSSIPAIIWLAKFKWLIARTAEDGSRQLVWGAVGIPDEGLDKLRGAYIHLSRVQEPSDYVLGEEGKMREDKLWADLISILGKVDPRIQEVVARNLA